MLIAFVCLLIIMVAMMGQIQTGRYGFDWIIPTFNTKLVTVVSSQAATIIENPCQSLEPQGFKSFERAVRKKVKGNEVTVRFYQDGTSDTSVRLAPALAKRINGSHRFLILENGPRASQDAQTVEAALTRLAALTDDEKLARKTPACSNAVEVATQPKLPPASVNLIEAEPESFIPEKKSRVVNDVEVLDQVEGTLVAYGLGEQTHTDGHKYICYYADVRSSKGVERKLGKDLERAITDAQATIGTEVSLVKTGIQYLDAYVEHKGKKKSRHKNFWRCTVLV